MTGITATTTAPDEVARLFEEYAGVLDMYASDQLAMVRRYTTKREKKDAELRAEIYSNIAAEMREIKFIRDMTKGIKD